MFAFSDDRGVSLIEVMLALTILATALLAMGGLMFQTARHTEQAAASGYRSAASISAAAWAQGIPWDSLDALAGCSSDAIGAFTYDRCLTVLTLSSKLKRATVTIQATGELSARPDTVVVDRNRPRIPSPLSP